MQAYWLNSKYLSGSAYGFNQPIFLSLILKKWCKPYSAPGWWRSWMGSRAMHSTRSQSGRRCRDTFASLKKICHKNRLSFWQYVQDRVFGWHRIAPLAQWIFETTPTVATVPLHGPGSCLPGCQLALLWTNQRPRKARCSPPGLLPIKAVWVYPFDRHFRRVLCGWVCRSEANPEPCSRPGFLRSYLLSACSTSRARRMPENCQHADAGKKLR